MTSSSDIRLLLVRDLETMIREVDLLPDDQTLWRTPPGITNSVGNLGLHLAGNIQHFIGRVLGGSEYIRDRDREFSQREGTRAEVVAQLRRAIEAVNAAMPALDDARLNAVYPERVGGIEASTRLFLMHLVAHLTMHVGQAGYLRRVLTGDATSAGPTPVSGLRSP